MTFDETGKRYARLRVIERVGADRYAVICDCGSEKVVRGTALRCGHTTSCGCLHREQLAAMKRKHGHASRSNRPPRAYAVWASMRARCNSTKESVSQWHGARGIRVCERWNDFAAFLADMGEPPTTKHSIDRINNDGDYEPGNCRWATAAEQTRNTRRNVLLTFRGKTQCMTDWAREFGMTMHRLRSRLASGWPLPDALTKPPNSRVRGGSGRIVTERESP